jgi:hypothetical protein
VARLVAIEGSLEGQTFPVERGLTLGREKHNDVNMPQNRQASRDHAKVWEEAPKRYAVADLGSTNGTLVNGHKVTRVSLADGDEVRIGESVFRFELDEEEKARPKPAPAERPDLAAVLRGEAKPSGGPAPGSGAPGGVGSIEVKQRILQYHKKGKRRSALRTDVSQTAGAQRWLLILAAVAVAALAFFLARGGGALLGGGPPEDGGVEEVEGD